MDRRTVDRILKFLDFFNCNTVLTPKDAYSPNKGFDTHKILTGGDRAYALKSVLDLAENEKLDSYILLHNTYNASKIKKIETLFIDLDAGRESNGKYKTKRKADAFKRLAMKRIQAFVAEYGLDPTAIVETRNGYQLYWKLLDSNVRRHLWTQLQNKIYAYFSDYGADPRVLKPNQILRLPLSTWYKKYEGFPSFKCKLMFYPHNVYYMSTVCDALSAYEVVSKSNKKSDSAYWLDYWSNIATRDNRLTHDTPTPSKKIKNPNPASDLDVDVTIDNQIIRDAVAFLFDSAKMFDQHGSYFMGKSARVLATKLKDNYL